MIVCRKEYYKEYREANKEKIKEYYQKNKEKLKEKVKEYQKNRKKTNPLFKMRCSLSSRTREAFKVSRWNKNNTTEKLLGCNYETAFKYLEKQFTKGMKWSNQGKWHIDHKIPLASAKTETELIKLCFYTNLQPLWAEDNLSKSAKINGQQTFLYL